MEFTNIINVLLQHMRSFNNSLLFWAFLEPQGRWDRTAVDNNLRRSTGLRFTDTQTWIYKLKLAYVILHIAEKRRGKLSIKILWRVHQRLIRVLGMKESAGGLLLLTLLTRKPATRQPQPLGCVSRSALPLHCSAERCRLCRPPARQGETVPYWALPHLYNIWHQPFATSFYTCFLTSAHSGTGNAPPPSLKRTRSFQHGGLSDLRAPAAPCWCDFCTHSTVRGVWLPLWYTQHITLAPSRSQCPLKTAHSLLWLFPLFPLLLCSRAVPKRTQEQVHPCCFRRHFSDFNVLHLVWTFLWCSQHLRSSHED